MPIDVRIVVFVVGTLLWLAPRPGALRAATPASVAGMPVEHAAGSGTQSPRHADLVFIAAADFTVCARPADPAAPPDGTSATRAQMLAAQQMMKAYDAVVTAYTKCIDGVTRMVLSQYESITPAVEVEAVKQLSTKLHNGAVDRDETLVNRFNLQLRTFLARQRPQHSSQSPLPPTS